MKKALLYFLLINGLIFAQDPHRYFPHHVGNLWFWSGFTMPNNIIHQLERDSVDENGYTYISEDTTSAPHHYWRWKINPTGDSIIYGPKNSNFNWLQYKFPLDSGDVWKVDNNSMVGVVVNKYPVTPWGRPSTAYLIHYYPDTTFFHYIWWEVWVEGIGRIRYGDEVYQYELVGCIIDGDTLGNIKVDVKEESVKIPLNAELYQNYPNPFNPVTTISFDIKEAGLVSLKVYDILGNEVVNLFNGYKEAGSYSCNFNATNLPSGTYFYTLKTGTFTQTQKMSLLK